MHPLQSMIKKRELGSSCGMYSACSAHEFVIEAVLQRAREYNEPALIEATANQVNQDGGYTGMTPSAFRDYVFDVADRIGFPRNNIILGGDHLGPLIWSHLPTTQAMEKAKELIRQFVAAGYTKIHIDTSMYTADDDRGEKLSDRVIAERGAVLAEVAEAAWATRVSTVPSADAPVYIVGSEVPIPGGAQGEEDGIQVTKPEDFETTFAVFRTAFSERKLEAAWHRVVGFVVQPGVEFGDDTIHHYDRIGARNLTAALKSHPGIVFEGHSTDYQIPEAMRQMVEDGIAILKVGPALTFALREALLALELIEKEIAADRLAPLSRFSAVLEERMLANPESWRNHYHGDAKALKLSRRYSYSDRCRYYLPDELVDKSIHQLIENLGKDEIPLTLVSQYLPLQYRKILTGKLQNNARGLIIDHIGDCIDAYHFATRG